VIVNGLILAEDGKKMSKSLKNYPDPNGLLEEHGADALRLYLINSPVVRAQEIRFSEKGVVEVVRKILLRWWNAYSFFINYANADQFIPEAPSDKFNPDDRKNILDKWIFSRLHSLMSHTQKEMEAYRLYQVVPHLLSFIEELTNTYIRLNRPHFWQSGMPPEKKQAFQTLYEVLLQFAKIMAPFAPFISETQYLNLKRALPSVPASVHLCDYPLADSRWISIELEEAVQVMEAVVTLGRNYREKIGVKGKIPLSKLQIIHRDPKVLAALKPFEPYFLDELNIRLVEYVGDEDQFVQVGVKANFPILGKRLGAKMKIAAKEIEALSIRDILRLERGESVELSSALGTPEIRLEDIEVRRTPRAEHPDLQVSQTVSIWIDKSVDAAQMQEGLAREALRKIQQARKNAGLELSDRIKLSLAATSDVRKALETHRELLVSEALCIEVDWKTWPEKDPVSVDESPVKGTSFAELVDFEWETSIEKIAIGISKT
jgi:isoleucyl-tRNA synthetase